MNLARPAENPGNPCGLTRSKTAGALQEVIYHLRIDHAWLRDLVRSHHIEIFEMFGEDRLYDFIKQPISMTADRATLIINRSNDKAVFQGLIVWHGLPFVRRRVLFVRK